MSIRRYLWNLKSVALTVLELLAFNPQNLGPCDPDYATFLKKNWGVISVLSLRMYVRFEALNILELLAFNPQNLGVMWPYHAPFLKKIGVSCPYCPWEDYVRFEVCSFNHFEAIVCFRLTDNALYPWPRFGQELTYFTKWVELPISSF